jgi:hypothetical protein
MKNLRQSSDESHEWMLNPTPRFHCYRHHNYGANKHKAVDLIGSLLFDTGAKKRDPQTIINTDDRRISKQ